MRIVAKGRTHAELLNEELRLAIGERFVGMHSDGEAVVDCDPADEAAARAIIEAHVARTPAEQATALKDYLARTSVDGIDRLQFEHLFELENTTRGLKAVVNVMYPGTYSPAESAQVTLTQYRNALINRWKALNP